MTKQKYIDLYGILKEKIRSRSTEVLNVEREEALTHFTRKGFPTSNDEEYRHTDIMRFFSSSYNFEESDVEVNPEQLLSELGIDADSLLLVNGDCKSCGHEVADSSSKLFVGSISDFSNKYPEIFSQHYSKIVRASDDSLVAFNTMFVSNGLVVYVPKGISLDNPIDIVNAFVGEGDRLVNGRMLFIVEDGAKVSINIKNITQGGGRFLTTQVIELFVGENSFVDITEIENNSSKVVRHSSFFSNQKENSVLRLSSNTFRGGCTRNNYTLNLLGQNIEAYISGVAVCDKSQGVDNHVFINHAEPHSTSTQLFKNILQDQATGVFSGKILVAQDAQKTQAYQTNRNLCLSREARMYSIPQLEIYADDVKCSHGLTTGQIENEALFYMQARGISKDDARRMLMIAFCQDVIDMVQSESVQEEILSLVEERLR